MLSFVIHQLTILLTFFLICQQLYALGARKFVVTGVPAIGCAPKQRVKSKTSGCNEILNFWARKYNYGLKYALQAFKSEFNNTNYSYLDTYGAVTEFIYHPSKYGTFLLLLLSKYDKFYFLYFSFYHQNGEYYIFYTYANLYNLFTKTQIPF